MDWNPVDDHLIFDISDIARLMREVHPTKRNTVSLATRFYDPLDVISPLTVRFKLLFQQLCERKLDWDEPLTGELLTEWESLSLDLQRFRPIKIPRCYTEAESSPVNSYSLLGYCDASQRAYAAVVYLQVETTVSQFLCSKTRVAPVKKVTIPRLELLSALLLARLISTIQRALEPEIPLSRTTCHTDSQVTLYWITGEGKEWKQFVQNRVIEIRELVPITSWRHCPGVQNPADIPSRGVSPFELQEKLRLWLHGPQRLPTSECVVESEGMVALPKECLAEMRMRDRKNPTVNLMTTNNPATVLSCERYSNLKRLLRVTAWVLKFVNAVKKIKPLESSTPIQDNGILAVVEIQQALTYWLKVSQSCMPEMKNFQQWSKQYGLFQDGIGLWRCGGRLDNSKMPQAAKHPILLNKEHYLALLITRECHERVRHGGVKATLTELRSQYWIVRGRCFIKRILRGCVMSPISREAVPSTTCPAFAFISSE